ncbi:wd-repeat protein [Emericellopsis atlantica]|uniref:Wd-repeat protein n=1 Tax=Emericellopsis atlantica TaxID=2614577 RepID=A0A9P7ZMZ4_9HYPO|nr:wd-repeat protein [Emericellopsis atlantica]KAG9255094.1 wd-repeat protein [Emericellopsis atlantica]
MGWLSDRLRRHKRCQDDHTSVEVAVRQEGELAITEHSQPQSEETTIIGQTLPRRQAHRPQIGEVTVGEQASQEQEPVVQRPAPGSEQQRETGSSSCHASSSDPWSAAYQEAFGQLSEELNGMLKSGRNLEELFRHLNEANQLHKDESLLRRGMERIQKPIKYLEMMVSLTSPLASVHPASSVAFGIVQSVTTLAIGVCGVEERLNQQITRMLEHINIIDGCDALDRKSDGDVPIHMALVLVYKDLLLFYHEVIQVLAKKSTALAWMSEQLNARIPPVVEDFLRHSDQLRQHIDNATAAIIRNIEEWVVEETIKQSLGNQKISQLDAFHKGLKQKMAPSACSWVGEDPTFRQWYDNAASRPLVILGDMGCGKTVTMSYLIEHVKRLNKVQIPRPITVYHYCRDDETGNDLYIYSSLLQQLMQHQPRLKIQFHQWFKDLQGEGELWPTQDVELLSAFFFTCVDTLERPLFALIDGLDECEEGTRERLVARLRHHSAANPKLRVCMSTRYQEDVQRSLQGSLEIRMHHDESRDDTIVCHLVTTQLPRLKGESRHLVISKLSKLAKGSAIWVQTAVNLLAKKKVTQLDELGIFLRHELPESELSDLYAKLFSQVTENDEDNMGILTFALEALALAERPLSISELSWAVAQRRFENQVASVQDYERRIDTERALELCIPFVAGIDYETRSARQIRLMHQSVREMVLQAAPSQWAHLRASSAGQGAVHVRSCQRLHDRQQRQLELHGQAVRACVRYCLMADLENLTLFTEEECQTQALDEMPGACVFEDEHEMDGDPVQGGASGPDAEEHFFNPSDRGFGELFTYSSCYWLHHLRRAGDQHGLALADILALTAREARRAQNWWDQFYRPDCSLRPDESQSRPETLETLPIVFLYGSDTLALEMLDFVTKETDAHSMATQTRNAVKDLLRSMDLRRLPLLLRYSPDQNLQMTMDLFSEVMRHWARMHRGLSAEAQKDFETVFDHIAGAFELMVQQQWGNQMLCSAASYGCLPMMERLFAAARSNPALGAEMLRAPHRDAASRFKTAFHHQSIGDAAWNGRTAAVAFLLEQEGIDAHLRYVDVVGNNVFHKAARCGDVEMFRLLASRFPEGVNHRNKDDDMPIQVLVFERSKHRVVKFLLEEAHADVRCGITAPDGHWKEPLRMATRYGDLDMCRILVRSGGADPMSVFERQGDTLAFKDPIEDMEVAAQLRQCLLS